MPFAFLRPFDSVSMALYAAAFRAGRRLGRQVRERCGEPSNQPEAAPEPDSSREVPTFHRLPGVTVEGVDIDSYELTPDNHFVVDLRAEGDHADYEARWAEALAAIEAGKAVVFADVPADRGLFSIGRLDGRYVVSIGVGPISNFADLDAAMRHGFSAVEEYQ